MEKVTSVEAYIKLHPHFSRALHVLRNILTNTELEETIKWNAPVYTINGKNVIGLSAFKQHFGLWFFNDVFLKDTHNQLINAQENKTKTLRQMRFKSIDDINETIVVNYIKEAIENQKLWSVLKPIKNKKEIIIPQALKNSLDNDEVLNKCFKSLTPYKQREFCEYISSAKRATTAQTRLKKIISLIMQGIGLNDRYRK
ncbi:YdeI/OmpD-associated family protein [Snuella lapsa]|uniref:YdhG-like domain-containing protein n=1 Tax=Snuella lapsa TaxID=870481 RepID=A0ABP6XIV2_9FLAO